MKIKTRFTFLYLKRLMTWAQHFPCRKSLLSKLSKNLQMYLDVDCRDLKYTYAPTKEVDAAALRLEHKLRG